MQFADGDAWVGPEDRCARIERDLAAGVPTVLRAGDQVALALAAETLTQDRLDQARAAAPNAAWALAVTARRARTLKARVYDGDVARIALDPTLDAGVVRAIADPAAALDRPLLGPHFTLRDGDAAAADVARAGVALLKRARLLPALAFAMVDPTAAEAVLARGVAELRVDDVWTAAASPWRAVSSARVPIAGASDARLTVFRQKDRPIEHFAFEIGEPRDGVDPLVRLHSACATGDLFGSLKCDCGPQLRAALDLMVAAGRGVLVYLNQEGRGIGLANKLRAYRLQDQGFDTVEANHRLGFRDDERALGDGADVLRALNVRRARLLTNNPAKVAALTDHGVDVVERVPLTVGRTAENDGYLSVKAAKSGHLL